MKNKRTVLTVVEENERAQQSLLRGECFISKVPLNDKEYELVWHAGAQTYVFVDKIYITDNLLNSN